MIHKYENYSVKLQKYFFATEPDITPGLRTDPVLYTLLEAKFL